MTPDKDRILTVPNLVTFIRLIGVGVFWWLLLKDRIVAAAWFIFGIGWTDWVDGYLARKLNQVSRLGAALDPIADRLLIFSAVLGGLIAGVIPFWFGVLLIAREVLMGIVAATLAARGHGVLAVRYLGKLATFMLLGAIPSFYLASAGVLPGLMSFLGWSFGVIGLVLYWFVAFQYLFEALSRMGGVKSTDLQERDE